MTLCLRNKARLVRQWAVCLVVPLVMVLGTARTEGLAVVVRQAGTAQSIIDADCNRSQGVVVPEPAPWMAAGGPSVALTVLASGLTLVVTSMVYPAAPYAEVRAYTSTCVPDVSFGDKGAERLVLEGENFHVSTAIPALGGGALLAGERGGKWLVARLDQKGQLDQAFGTHGWEVLPWHGEVSAMAQEPSGTIVLGGWAGGIGNFPEALAEVDEHGSLVRRFGHDGRATVPYFRDDSELSRIAFERNGEILALTLGGNMGAWGIAVSAFEPGGAPVPSFEDDFGAALQKAAPPAFVADIDVRANGFLLIGTGQEVPVTDGSSPTATGEAVAFEPSGTLDTSFADHGEVRFP